MTRYVKLLADILGLTVVHIVLLLCFFGILYFGELLISPIIKGDPRLSDIFWVGRMVIIAAVSFSEAAIALALVRQTLSLR